MKLTRRDFLRWASLSAVGAVACNPFTDSEFDLQSPVRLPEDLVTGEDNWYATLCGQCPEQEGILVRVFQGRAKKVQGNPIYPTNQGKQSVRCDGGLQALYHPDRIAKPLRRTGPRGDGLYVPVEWDEAMDLLKDKLLPHRGSDALLMVTEPLRGHLGGVARRFSEAYGGRHMAFEALDNVVLRRAVKEVFDQDLLPDLDIDNTRYLLSFGADFLSTWVSPTRFARGYGQFRQGDRRERGHFLHIDPRFSMTAASADEWVPVRPGTEGVLALSIAYVIMSNADRWGIDAGVVNTMTGGAGPEALSAFAPDKVTDPSDPPLYVGMPERLRGQSSSEVIHRIAEEFATRRPSLAFGGGEASAHTNGLFNLKAIFALNHLVGSVNQRGGIVFNPQPPVGGFHQASGPSTLTEWEQAANRLRKGEVKALLVHGVNPIHGLPDAVGFKDALSRDDLFIASFASVRDETSDMADLILPVRTPMEDWGDDAPEPGPGYQIVGIRQPVVNPLPGLDPRGFGDILITLAQELGFEAALPYTTFQDVLREGARELYDLDRGSITKSDTPTFEDFWRLLLQRGGWWDEQSESKAISFSPPDLASLARLSVNEVTPSFKAPPGNDLYHLVPFASNSLLEGRGASLPWMQSAPDPLTTVAWQTWIEINIRDAEREGFKLGDVVRVFSDRGEINALAYPHPAIPPGVVAVPLGQGHTSEVEYSQGKGANLIPVLSPEKEKETEAFAWAATRVRLEREGSRKRVTKFEAPATSVQPFYERIVRVVKE